MGDIPRGFVTTSVISSVVDLKLMIRAALKWGKNKQLKNNKIPIVVTQSKYMFLKGAKVCFLSKRELPFQVTQHDPFGVK